MHRNARQARLAGVGPDGQARIARAHVDVPLDGLAADVAARYLAGAGVAGVRVRSAALGEGARAIDARVLVDVDPSIPPDATAATATMGLHDPAAQAVAQGARFALEALRRALGDTAARYAGRLEMRDVEKHPWATGDLRIDRHVLEAVFDEARRAYARDEESCGVLVGPASDGRRIDGLIPMLNRANKLHALDPEAYPRTGRMYFDIDSMKFEAAMRKGDAEGRPVKVLYHSHLDAGAYFSATDAEVAKMGRSEPPWDLAYLVTSVRAGQVDDRRLFVWEPISGTFAESRLDVLEAKESP